jgi:hypothetical protein
MWIAYPDGIERVEVVEKGTGGRRYRDKANKPKDPYVVENDDETFVVCSDDLFDSPVAASCRRAELCKSLGMEMNDPRLSNPTEDEDEEDDESDEEDLEDDTDPDSDDEEEEEETDED